MKIAIIGATGRVGTRLIDEALSRGHTVTAIARQADKLAARPGLATINADVADTEALAAATRCMNSRTRSCRCATCPTTRPGSR